MQDIRLIALDLDGTLLTTDKQLTDRNRAALERAAGEGILIVPATGRIYAGLPEEIRQMPYVRYFLLANGATVYDREEDRVIYCAEILPDKAVEVMSWLDGYPVIYDCYQENRGYMTSGMWDQAEYYAPSAFYLQHIRTLRKPVPDLKEFIRMRGKSIQKMQAFCPTPEIQVTVRQETAHRFPELAVSSSVARNVEINDAGANKGKGLKALADCLQIGMEKVVAFGDGSNDLSMIRAAGIGVAMGNAVPELLEDADRITAGNDEDGVGRMIEALLRG